MANSILQVFPATGSSLEETINLPCFSERPTGRLLFADGVMPPLSLETHVTGFWNESFLFILFCGRFLELRVDSEPLPPEKVGRTPHLWEKSDVYEAMLGWDCGRTGHYREFQVAPNGRWVAADVRLEGDRVNTNEEWDVSFRCLSSVDEEEKIWKAAMQIPWQALGGLKGEGNLQCNFYRATGKFHGDELLAWSPIGYGDHCFYRPHLFGRVVLARQ